MQLFINALAAGSIYALVAIGFSVVYGSLRFFHFAHGAIYSTAAYAAYLTLVVMRWPPVIGVIVAVVTGTVLGLGIDLVVYRPLRRRRSSPLVLFLASLAVLGILQNLLSLLFGDQTRTLRAGIVGRGVSVFGGFITPTQILIVILTPCVYLAVTAVSKRSRYGRLARAVADDRELAEMLGVRLDEVALFVITLGSALAAMAGVLVAYDTDLAPMMGFNALLMGMVAALVGGIGSIAGAGLGGLLVGTVQNVGVWKLPASWQEAILFGLLLLFLLVRPRGILGHPNSR